MENQNETPPKMNTLNEGKRVLKFRGYDLSTKQMLPVELINFREDYITLNEGDNGLTDTMDMIVLMQFTGLCDKNGLPIYEGDILKTPLATSKTEFNYTYVEYRNEIASYIKRTADTRGYTRLEIRIAEVEIIGNIHQHPHLLTATSND